MKRTIAIVCGGDTSEFQVSLRSAQGIYSFIDKEKYTLYIVEMHGLDWHVQLPDGGKVECYLPAIHLKAEWQEGNIRLCLHHHSRHSG